MVYYPPVTAFDKSYYREAIQTFDPISIELLPDWLWRVEDAEMKYKDLYFGGGLLTADGNLKVSEAWTQFRKIRIDFLNWFNGLLWAHGYNRFLDEDNYWKLQRIIEFKHEH